MPTASFFRIGFSCGNSAYAYLLLLTSSSAHALTADVSIEHTAHAAELFLSDGLIVTGASTGIATDVRDLHSKTRLRNIFK